MATFDDLVGPNWPPSPNCDDLPTLIAAIENIANEVANQTASPIKTGDLKIHTGTTPIDPVDGWLLCNGQAVSRTTYSTLFAVVGTQYGIGDGSTTFNVPDIRGRTAIGRDNMGGIPANVMTDTQADVLGGTGGSEFHTLDLSETPPHNHGGITGLFAGAGSTFAAGGGSTPTAILSQGGGNPHPNDQPWIAFDIYIKT